MLFLDFSGSPLVVLLKVATLLFGVYSAGHALLTKRDPRAAVGWIAFCILLPLFGSVFYWLFGVNRIRTAGRKLRARWPELDEANGESHKRDPLPPKYARYGRVSGKVTRRAVLSGNSVCPHRNGEEAYPAMLAAIRDARESVNLCTYIFDTDATGTKFVDALAEAHERGVRVKVIVDGVGERYSRPRVSKLLAHAGVPCASFLPGFLFSSGLHMNLRNHRKILVVDGELAFTGGMNLGDRHLAEAVENEDRVVDLHFELAGPVVREIEDVFYEDWCFATGRSDAPPERPALKRAGELYCRAISDGPNEDFEAFKWSLFGALSDAQERVRIVTPYFVPDQDLVAMIAAADLRGVEVQLLLPSRNNLPIVHWASRAGIWQIIKHGVQVYYQPPPFVHTKLLIVDDCYAMVGSANLDARSLRLNFELNVEIYGEACVAWLDRHFEEARDRSHPATLEEMDARPFFERLRDSTARLFSPYL